MEALIERSLMGKTKRPRAQGPGQEAGASGATPRVSRRKTAEFNVPIKLWVSQEMYDTLEAVAREREWSVPQVIRRAVRIVLGERKLG
jgi:hypothetical protein